MISWIRRTCSIVILTTTFMMAYPHAEAACPGPKGTFLQLTDAQLARPVAEWRQLFDEFRTIGINTLFVQWTVVDRKPLFYQARQHEAAAESPLGFILKLAAQSGIRVWFGLALDS